LGERVFRDPASMSNRIRRWRWRLARWVAPETIIAGPPPSDTKAFIFMRDEQGPFSWTVWVPTTSLDVQMSTRIGAIEEQLETYVPSHATGTFSGTIG